MDEQTFAVRGTSESPTRTSVHVRDFSLTIDEPPEFEGEDSGPSPVEYLLTALVGCLNATAHVVAKEISIELRDLDIDAEGTIDPSRLYGESEEARPGLHTITISLGVECDADEAAIAQWRKMVESRCPVLDNIRNATPVSLHVDRMLQES